MQFKILVVFAFALHIYIYVDDNQKNTYIQTKKYTTAIYQIIDKSINLADFVQQSVSFDCE